MIEPDAVALRRTLRAPEVGGVEQSSGAIKFRDKGTLIIIAFGLRYACRRRRCLECLGGGWEIRRACISRNVRCPRRIHRDGIPPVQGVRALERLRAPQ